MIDLHMHTTASDGTLSPEDLVARVHAAGITTFSVTDHDTMAAMPAAAEAAARHRVAFVPGIEITSVHDGIDVHLLGYFLDAASPRLDALLTRARRMRVERAREIGERLAAAGAPIDVERLIAAAASQNGRSIGRPVLARAMVAAGHVSDVPEAFDRYLAEGACAFVPRCGPTPAEAIEVVRASGGLASLAHPGTLRRDQLVPGFVAAGLEAIEAHHSAHDAAAVAHYVEMARTHGLAISGGSDFHGDEMRRAEFFGVTCLPADEFERLAALRAGNDR